MSPEPAYTLTDLCALAGVTPRTVRYYVAEGILRPPGGSGPGVRYDEGHLARLRLVRRLQREHLPLAEIRSRLGALADDEAIGLAAAEPEPPRNSALDYVRAILGGKGIAPRTSGPGPLPAASAGGLVRLRAELQPPADAPDALPTAAARPAAPERSHWERITLAPDIEIHVRRPLTRSANRALVRLLEVARELLEEDQP